MSIVHERCHKETGRGFLLPVMWKKCSKIPFHERIPSWPKKSFSLLITPSPSPLPVYAAKTLAYCSQLVFSTSITHLAKQMLSNSEEANFFFFFFFSPACSWKDSTPYSTWTYQNVHLRKPGPSFGTVLLLRKQKSLYIVTVRLTIFKIHWIEFEIRGFEIERLGSFLKLVP